MISFISVATLFTPPMTSSIVVPAVATSRLPVEISATESSISFLISRAEVAERCARLRTSEATTAKPRPCSPARAASTAAFSARMLVWKAMPSITLMISTILWEERVIDPIVSTTCFTTSEPFSATADASRASWLAPSALAAFCFTVLVSCSIEAAVSTIELACSSVRADKSRLPLAIWREAEVIARLLSPT